MCRQRVLFFLDHLHTGDKVDFIVWPKDDHDCDAALLLEAKIWDSSEFPRRPPPSEPRRWPLYNQ